MGSSEYGMRQKKVISAVDLSALIANFSGLAKNDTVDDNQVEMLNKAAKIAFVRMNHTQAIYQMENPGGRRNGKWRTRYYQDGKRRELVRGSEEEIYLELYSIYSGERVQKKTLKSVFEELMVYKEEELARAPHTITVDRLRFRQVNTNLQEKEISEITKENIQKWITKEILPACPKADAFKKLLQLLSQIFELAMEREYCEKNPVKHIPVQAYLSRCNHERKMNEDKQFSTEERCELYREACDHDDNPRALMILVSMETGLRAGELASIHRDDIQNGYIHVHRQQIRETQEDGHETIYEVNYTKEERTHPHGGRFVPITAACREAIDKALRLPGKSVYLFHDEKGAPVHKDTYIRYLQRMCRRLGIKTTNNHAFRIAFNSDLIDLGFNSSERALILGHAIQTNEKNYSLTDRRKLENLKKRIDGAGWERSI